MSKRKIVETIIKITLSLAALYFVFSKIDFREVGQAIVNAKLSWLALALVIFSLSQIAASKRLLILFKLIDSRLTFKQNIKLYWLGLFYNLFLPGGVGGDGFKIYILNKYEDIKLKKIIGAILSDRVSGLVIIGVLILLLTSFLQLQYDILKWSWLLIPFAFSAYYIFLNTFYKYLKPGFFQTLIWSTISQLGQMMVVICILFALNAFKIELLGSYFFLFFLSAIAGALPITLGGIGAREFVFVWGATLWNINPTVVVSLSLLFYIVSAVSSLPGLMFVFKPSEILDS